MERIESSIARWVDRFNQTIWHSRRDECSAVQWLMIRLARTLVVSIRGFNRHHSTQRASALTFFTLLSLVPVAAMAFGIAKGFGFERRLQRELLDKFAAQQEVVQQVIGFAQNMLDNTRGDMIAGIGVVVLFWTVIKVLSNIEIAFNFIWGVRSRTFVRKLSDYLTIMLICPLLIIMSGSLTVYITRQVWALSGRLELSQMVDQTLSLGLKMLPYTLIWVLFTLVYIILPNTRVRFSGALLAGIIAGTAYQVVQAAYIHFQIGVAKYNAIYGSFAALPLFLLWLQISWLIVLFGAEISCAYQHSAYVDGTGSGHEMSISQRRLIALMICRHVVHRFRDGQPAQTARQIADALSLAPSIVDSLAELLVKGNILVRLDGDAEPSGALQPAQDIHRLSIQRVVYALDDAGGNGLLRTDSPDAHALTESLRDLRAELDRSAANRLIMDI